MTSPTIAVHGITLSGHTHRVVSFLSILGVPYRFVEAGPDVWGTPAFRALNPLRQIPVLQDGDLTLADSNAILVYLARRYAAGTPWLPDDPIGAAHVQRWLSIAAGEIKYGPAAARFATLWGQGKGLTEPHAISAKLLPFMDGHLAGRTFLATEHPTIADLSCYPYIARAPEGRISLADVPNVRAWIARIEALPGFLPMPVSELPEAKR